MRSFPIAYHILLLINSGRIFLNLVYIVLFIMNSVLSHVQKVFLDLARDLTLSCAFKKVIDLCQKV